MTEHTPRSVNGKNRLTEQEAEAAALALNAGFVAGGVEANLASFVALVALARQNGGAR